jgi:RHS repeat-associated protein
VAYALTADGWDAGYAVILTNGLTITRAVTRDPHRRHLIGTITNAVNGTAFNALSFGHDLLGRITNRNADTFSYNARSEVTSADIGSTASRYAYDSIGNNCWISVNAVTNTYTANALNQYTAIANQQSATSHPVYDADGNITWDGRFIHAWDAENRLVRSEPGWDGSTNGARRVVNRYDHMSRLVETRVEMLSGRGAGYPFDPSQGGTWDTVETRTFIYDGWLPVLEKITRTDGVTETREHVWGKDLSGTRGGAGGVGGLLATRVNDTWYFPIYDNNGNVTDYVNASGATVAHREYGPFGETRAASGPMADAFNFWFSTKYLHHETGFYYYGYRFYSPELMRWLNRDPIGEDGGDNVYGFTGNNPVTDFDVLGLVKGEVKHRPWWTPEVVDATVSGFGEIRAFLSENECRCKCVNNIYKLECRLSINYTIRIEPKDSPKWEKSMPASYPTFPVPNDYKTWPITKKRKFVENHERKHLAALKAWWTRRVEQLKGLETLQFSSGECENQQERAVRENEKQFRACYNDEVNHKHW